MEPQTSFSRLGKAYLWSVILAGVLVVTHSIYRLCLGPISQDWFILAALTLISGSATVKLPSSYASISISETFVFTAVLLYGPSAGTVIVALDALVLSFWISKRHDEPHRALFNMSAPSVSVWCSSHLFFWVSGVAPLFERPSSINAILPGLILFALAYFALNSWLIAFVIALERRVDPVRVWTKTFIWLSLNYFGGASVAILFVGFNLGFKNTPNLAYFGVIVPLLLVLYFTFKTTMGRVEDADRHVEEINTLYLSTIETLAMAIDAKDQVTHGHIRRVQTYATSLARELGVKDEKHIKAIEAAALLHDLGKLAVPEYILNKPGRLTDAEFEKMKLHANVGADILKSIAFPYPVENIVRYHHECWDGSGYPAGKKGTDIPIGARILSVVDCFDALTSDRPYRPRLSDEEAIQILRDRSGRMYDPLVVDSFIKVHQATASRSVDDGHLHEAINEIASARRAAASQLPPPVLEEIAASADEMQTLYELAQGLADLVSADAAGDLTAKHLRRLVPASLCVLYLYDPGTDELEATHAVGEGSSFVRGLRIPLGQRLSGWVAANRQTICNSDPTLDLGDAARGRSLRLRSCLSTPLVAGNELVGVLSLYSAEINGFSDDHRRVVEVVARQICHTLQRSSQFQRPVTRAGLGELPDLNQLEKFANPSSYASGERSRYALLFIEVRVLRQISSKYGNAIRDELLSHFVQHTRVVLRKSDVLFRSAAHDLIAFLDSTDDETAETVAGRIRAQFAQHPLRLPGGGTLIEQPSVTVACYPRDGTILKDLLSLAQRRALDAASERDGSTIH